MSKKGGKRGYLTRVLDSHIQNIQDTFQMLDKPADSSLDKVDWSEVVKFGDEVSKQATIAGMLWNGEAREIEALQENMEAYFNILNGFLLMCQGSTTGAGPTLHGSIRSSAKQVVDCSLSLLKECVANYERSSNPGRSLTVPQLSGKVWEACTTLKKTPTTNCMAVVRAITQVAISVKDVHREMSELKSSSEASENDDAKSSDQLDVDDLIDEDLSPEEMLIAQLVIGVTSNSLEALKEVIRFISGLRNNSSMDLESKDFIEILEILLSHCKEIGSQVSELGACVYPPQEMEEMKEIVKKIDNEANEIRRGVESIESSKEKIEKLILALQVLQSSLGRFSSGLAAGLVSEMNGLCV